ncbi:MAG TPA: aspartyl/asparaginyl beta-hydroxylase domain-containing protein [Rhizomicrobium sp.]|nr:aspartyl/asparaginyl beta-hydroxylase domain-containing protein [Rhizomicrobium sp.]
MQSAALDIRVRMLVQTAQQLMAEGRLEDAARAWDQVLATAPEHPLALYRLGQHRFFRRDMQGALQLLQRAERADPTNANAPLSLAFVHRALNDNQGEMAALQRALTIDPYFVPALLAKGMLLERVGQPRQAAQVYKAVVTIAPADDQLSAELREALVHARDVVRINAEILDEFLGKRLGPVRARHAGEKLSRFEECKDVVLGRQKVYTQQPSMLHIPHLPAITFYDREEFPWLAALEAATPDIRREALAVLQDCGDDIVPYVSHPDGSPINQWAELNHSPRWSTYFLWKDGVRYDRQCEKCPVTARASEALPVVDTPNFGPTIMYSLLAPHTRIPPHSSVTNARLVVHLPLIVPDGCQFRVGNDTRPWREGEAWVFDDTIEHEAWNNSDQHRMILMIDIWNPYLSIAERELINELLNGVRDYYDGERIDIITGLAVSPGKAG